MVSNFLLALFAISWNPVPGSQPGKYLTVIQSQPRSEVDILKRTRT